MRNASRLRPGEVHEGLDFRITAFPAATIRGRVLGIDGAPTRAVVLTIEAIGPALPAAASGVGRIDNPNQNAEFEVHGVSRGCIAFAPEPVA